MTDLDQRRLVLGDELAVLLSAAGMSGRALAQATGWQPSKVSRVINGKQAATDSDVVAWCRATGTSEDETQRLRATLRSIRAEEMRWSRQLVSGHRALQDDMAALEARASHIRTVDVALVPGLVQTADYAAALLRTLAAIRRSTPDTDEAVRARMQRQHILYDRGKTIELLTSELALRNAACDAETMAAQLDRLLAVQGLPSLRMGILPLGATMPVPLLHGFCVLDERVMVETWHREDEAEDPADVALYHRIADALWGVALEGEDARALLLRVARDYANQPRP